MQKEIWLRLLDKTVSGEIVWDYSILFDSFQTIIKNNRFCLQWKRGCLRLTIEDDQGRLIRRLKERVEWVWQNPPAKQLYRYLQEHTENKVREIRTVSEQDILNILS